MSLDIKIFEKIEGYKFNEDQIKILDIIFDNSLIKDIKNFLYKQTNKKINFILALYDDEILLEKSDLIFTMIVNHPIYGKCFGYNSILDDDDSGINGDNLILKIIKNILYMKPNNIIQILDNNVDCKKILIKQLKEYIKNTIENDKYNDIKILLQNQNEYYLNLINDEIVNIMGIIQSFVYKENMCLKYIIEWYDKNDRGFPKRMNTNSTISYNKKTFEEIENLTESESDEEDIK